MTAVLDIGGLTIRAASGDTLVDDFSLSVARGEIVGIVGESGSGKSMVARSILDLLPFGVRRHSGSILLEGQSIDRLTRMQLRQWRGAKAGMIFQEPMTSLNPSMRIGEQLAEGLEVHRRYDTKERRKNIIQMLARVGMRDPEWALTAYPHEFSGGMRQRVMLASVMLLQPKLLVADEPTTALDAIVEAEVLDLMVELAREKGSSILLISHDLKLVAHYAQRVAVMSKGQLVETGKADKVLFRPDNAYTRTLLAALPKRTEKYPLPDTKPLVEIKDLVVEFGGRRDIFRRSEMRRAVDGVNLTIRPGEVLALVGESGSGKTTVGRTLAGLLTPSSGEILFATEHIVRGKFTATFRHNCQMVFQDPYSSLDPRMRVHQLIREAVRHRHDLSAGEKSNRVEEILDDVGLGIALADRLPHQLSGGQRQRVAIARAIVNRPKFVIADEAVSALDMTIRAQILDLLADLQQKLGFSCLFITHDLDVVEQIADRIAVMRAGKLVEIGTRDDIFDRPGDPYTRHLLRARTGPRLCTQSDERPNSCV